MNNIAVGLSNCVEPYAKDKYQITMLEQLSRNQNLPTTILRDINSLLKTTRIVENEDYQLVRRKRRLRNTFLADVSVLLGLAEKPLGLPYELMIEPTNICNLKCPLCPAGNGTLGRSQGVMKLEQFKGIIDELEDEVRRIVFWGFGEPFINKEAVDMIRYAASKRMFVLTSTNGMLLNDQALAGEIVSSGLQTLYVALDGLTQETLTKYRVGADIRDILMGVQRIRSERDKNGGKLPEIVLQFVVTQDNEHELPLVEEFYKKSGFDKWSIKNANIMATTDTPNFDSLAERYIPKKEQNARFERKEGGKLRIKGEVQNKCRKLFEQVMVNWDGTVVPCCWDPQSEHVLGDLKEERFTDIWFGDKYKNFREKVYKNRQEIQICCDCPTDRTVEKLSRRFTKK